MEIISYITYIIKSSALFSFIGAIIALFVPLAVMMHDGKEEIKFKWDKIVVLDYVIKAKKFFTSFVISCILTIMWIDNDCNWQKHGKDCLDNLPRVLWKIIILSSIVFFATTAIKSICNIYKWLKNPNVSKNKEKYKSYHQQKREEYLNKISNEQAVDIWNHTWSEIKKDDPYLNDYFDIFLNYIKTTEQDIFFRVNYSFIHNIKNYNYSRSDFQDKILKINDNVTSDNSQRIKFLKDEAVRSIIKSYVEDEDPYVSLSILYKEPTYIDYYYDIIYRSYIANTLKNDERLIHACSSIKPRSISEKCFSEEEKKLLLAFKKQMRSILTNNYFEGNKIYEIIEIFWHITFNYTPHISKKVLLILLIIQPYLRNLSSNNNYIIESTIKRILDKEYGFIFLETISVGRSFDLEESIEERHKHLKDLNKEEIKNMTNNSLAIYKEMYPEPLDPQTISILVKTLEQYKRSLSENKDMYMSGKLNIDANLYEFIDALKRIQEVLR